MIHGHVTAWVLALILFAAALFLQKSGKEKGAKVIKMILRVLYLLIIGTGFGLLFMVSNIDLLYILKGVVGLWIIALFEMILSRSAAKRKTSIHWIQFVVALLLVLYLGFIELPMSIMYPQ